MARIGVEQSALTDSRFDILAAELGCDRDSALGRMVRIWNECQERERYHLEPESVSAILRHPAGAEALCKSRLGRTNGDGSIHICGTSGRTDWLAKRRKEGRKGGKKGGRPRKTPITPTLTPRGLLPETPPAPASAPVPAPATDQREKTPDCAEPAADGRPAPAVFTLRAKEGKTVPIGQQQVDAWSEQFPGVDVLHEIRLAAGWMDDNPIRRKTAGGMTRFIRGWLQRSQDQGGSKTPPESPNPMTDRWGNIRSGWSST